MNDGALLRRYVEEGSEAAFADVVRRYHALVYAVCRRDVGDRDLAADVAQATFLVLARKAQQLRNHRSIAGWLFNTARLAAKDATKQERRRKIREQHLMNEAAHTYTLQEQEWAWSAIEPELNDAIGKLSPMDREAVLLRYVDGCASAEVGVALGVSEEAAKKRVARAVEKLRRHLIGVAPTLSIVLLTALLAERTAEAMPGNGVEAILRSVRSPGAGHTAISHGVVHAMRLTRIKAAITGAGAAIVAGAAGFAVLHSTTISSAETTSTRVSAPLTPVTPADLSPVATPPPAHFGAAVSTNVATAGFAYPELKGDFTLTYQVTDVDPATQVARDSYVLLVSHRDNELLTIKEDTSAPRKPSVPGLPDTPYRWVTLYDGTRTFSADNTQAYATVQNGFRCKNLIDGPAIGVNIPYLPFVKENGGFPSKDLSAVKVRALVAGGETLQGRSVYADANMLVTDWGGVFSPRRCTLSDGAHTIEKVTFAHLMRLGEISIPSDTTVTRYAGPEGDEKPVSIINGALVGAKLSSLPESAYNKSKVAADYDEPGAMP